MGDTTKEAIATATDSVAGERRRRSKSVSRFRRLGGLVWPLVAVAPSLVAMYGMFLWDRVYCYRDCIWQQLPFQRWFSRSIAAGELPFWDPYIAMGQPAITDPIRQLLFPPVLLLRFVPWPAIAHNLIIGLPMPVAALGVYVLLRGWLSKPSAAIGGIVYSCSAAMLSTASMSNLSWSAALAPWTVAAIMVLARDGHAWRLSVAAGVVGLQALAAEPVTFAMSLAIGCTWALAVAAPLDRRLVARAAFVAAAVSLGVVLAAVLLLPMFEATRMSARATVDAPSTVWSLHPLRLLECLVPFPYENPVLIPPDFAVWAGSLSGGQEPLFQSYYLGIPVVALASLGLVSASRRRAVWVALVGIACLVMAFGGHTPVYGFVHTIIPGLKALRYAEKYALGAVLAVAILSGEGWEALALGRCTWRRSWICFAAIAACGGLLVGAYVYADSIAAAVGASTLAATELRGSIGLDAAALAATAAASAGAVCALVARRHVRLTLLLYATTLVCGLILHGVNLNPQIDVSLLQEPAWVVRAKQIGGRAYVGIRLIQNNRAYFDAHPREEATFPDTFRASVHAPRGTPSYVGEVLHEVRTAQYSSQWGLREVLSVDPTSLWSRSYHRFADTLFLSSREARAVALERTGVRTQLRADQPLGAYDAVEEVEGIEPTVVAYSHEPFEMAFVATESQVEPDEAAAIKRGLFEAGFDMKREALLERESGGWGRAGAPEAAGARIVKQRDDAMEVEATAPGEATLVIVENYDPGWRARVDGEAAEVVRVDGILRGVRLRPGRHRVELWYVPRGLAIGAAITATTALLLALLAAWSVWRGKRRPRPE